MSDPELKARLAARFREVNGDHPMTAADDAYVTAWFTDLDDLCRDTGRDADEVRRLMLAGRLPLPGYLRSDGAQMVPPDLFDLAGQAGGIDALRGWFLSHWDDPGTAEAEWAAYLDGQYVCLRSVTPQNIQYKDALVSAIGAAPAEPDAGTPAWTRRLHALVDELDALEPPFTAYDRLRFAGPVSRDRCVDAVRARYPRDA
ncbi:DUF6058 family natural product biosynthesis protein [Actinomadura sp. NPDC000929]|uniref:DUF6058 family natural product biosynthesis protein n=1 Tax=Actinomadura sp. NPDC000929 TaxID=3154517 RepID=UPI00339205C6